MLRNVNTDPRDDNCCVLTYEEEEHWLLATWHGFVYPSEAMAGASAYLAHAVLQPSAFLLNDHTGLRDP